MKVTVKYYQKGERFEPIQHCETEEMYVAEGTSDLEVCEHMFSKYNSDDRPDGKIRRSMSVGDIVSIDGRAYHCASVGFERL